MLKMGHLKNFLITSAIFMVAYTRTTTEFMPAASGGCGCSLLKGFTVKVRSDLG